MKHKYIKTVVLCLYVMFVFCLKSFAANETLTAGAFIVNMGATNPGTIANSLKPYGLIYDLIRNYNVPVKFIVNPSKSKDGVDFTYNGVQYKGGTFVINSEYRTAAVNSRITFWMGQGVVGATTTTALTLDITQTMDTYPRWTLDAQNGDIAEQFLLNAGINNTTFPGAYNWKLPSQITGCDDYFVMPHADPTWATHGALWSWNKNYLGSIWAGCHAVSVLENLSNPANPAQKMNFLTTTGLVPFGSHNDGSPPYTHQYVTDPIAQYMGKTDGAMTNGSEQIYLPKLGGAWHAGTKLIAVDPTQSDIPTRSPGAAAAIVYGRGMNDTTRGFVMYEAGHDINKGSADDAAAQRVFFNFSFFNTIIKRPAITITGITENIQIQSGATIVGLNVVATSLVMGTTFTYQWTSSCGGSFSNPTGATTNYTAPTVINNLSCNITCKITDNCGRTVFNTFGVLILGNHPPTVINDSQSIDPGCGNVSLTYNVLANDTDEDGQPLALTNVTNPANGVLSFNSNGNITYTPNLGFVGVETLTYTVCDNTTPTALCTTGIYTITVGNASNVPNSMNDAFTIAEDVESRLNVLANDLPLVAGPLTVSAITAAPANGKVSINIDNTITYLPNADFTGTDNFTYRIVNSIGYSKTATVTVTITNNLCDAGTYQTGTTSSNVTLTATEDTEIWNKGAAEELENYGSCDKIYVNGSATSPKQRPLIRYDLSSIPSNATITSATVRLVKIGGASTARNVSIHRLTNNWTEGTGGCGGAAGVASWQQRMSSTAWTTAGGDFDATATATVSVAANAAYTFTATSLVQGWVDGTLSNHGIMVKFTTENLASEITLASTENATTANRPQLLVSYTVPVCAAITTRAPQAMPDTVTTPNAVSVNIATAANDYYPVAGGRVYSIITVPASGITSINVTTGVITYTPNTTFNGVRSMVYRVLHTASGLADTAYAYVNITNGAIVANNDYPGSSLSGVTQTINVKANDFDPEVATLSASYIVTIVTPPNNGTSSVNVSGSIVYTPNVGFTGNDTLFYSVVEPTGPPCGSPLRDTAMVVIVVLNRTPVPVDDNTSGPPCNAITLNLISNDSDPEGNTLTVTNLSALNPPGAGTLINNNDGTVTFTPAIGFIGVVTFTYRLTDNGVPPQLSAQATVTITIVSPPVNNPPVAINDNETIMMDEPLYKNVRNNDYDPDQNELTIPVITVAPLHGTASVNPINGLIEYMPNPGYYGPDILTYQVCDIITSNPATCAPSIGACATATLTINISIPNTTYTVNDENSTWINTAVSGVTIINDFDLERDAIIFGGFIDTLGVARISGSITVSGFAVNGSLVANAGTLAIQATGAYNYIPATGFAGYMRVPYIIYDNQVYPATDTGYLAITVSQLLTVANSIIPNNDEDITYGSTISRNLFENDREVQRYTYSATAFSYDSNGDGNPDFNGTLGTTATIGGLTSTDKSVTNAGSFILDASGNYTFTPATDFHGSVTVNYTVCGTTNPYCATSQLQIKILTNGNGGANDPPFGGDDFEFTHRNIDKSGSFFNNDREPNGDPISLQGVTINPAGPKNLIQTRTTLRGGTVNFYSNGTYLYTPFLNYIGPDLITYSLCDVTATAPQPICAGVSLHMLVAEVGSVLPVSLLDFSGKLNADKVDLYWVTTNEVNAENFVVERSIDGQHFTPIGTIKASGTFNNVENYTLVDPMPAKGANYYRLKMNAKGGTYTYSKIIIVRIINGNMQLITQIRPNPFTNYVDLYITLTKTMPVDLNIFDEKGRLVFQKSEKGNKGLNWFTIRDLQKLPGGMYLLKIVTDTDIIVEKLIKQ